MALQAVALSGLCVVAVAIVLTHDPLRQAFVVGIYGFLLAITFFLFQAPDVALSEIVIATVALPVMMGSLSMLMLGHAEVVPLLAASEFVAAAGVILFACNVFLNVRQGSTMLKP